MEHVRSKWFIVRIMLAFRVYIGSKIRRSDAGDQFLERMAKARRSFPKLETVIYKRNLGT